MSSAAYIIETKNCGKTLPHVYSDSGDHDAINPHINSCLIKEELLPAREMDRNCIFLTAYHPLKNLSNFTNKFRFFRKNDLCIIFINFSLGSRVPLLH